MVEYFQWREIMQVLTKTITEWRDKALAVSVDEAKGVGVSAKMEEARQHAAAYENVLREIKRLEK